MIGIGRRKNRTDASRPFPMGPRNCLHTLHTPSQVVENEGEKVCKRVLHTPYHVLHTALTWQTKASTRGEKCTTSKFRVHSKPSYIANGSRPSSAGRNTSVKYPTTGG